MYQMKKLKPMLAFFLALAVSVTEPIQSVGVVRAEEAAAEESAEVLDAEASDAEASDVEVFDAGISDAEIFDAESGDTDGTDGQAEDVQDAEETRAAEETEDAEDTQTQAEEKASAPEMGATSETEEITLSEESQTDAGSVQELEETAEEGETELEETTETDAEEMTDEAEENLKLFETEIKSAISIGRNEFITIKKNAENPWYCMEPKKDGAYIVRLMCCDKDCKLSLKVSGAEKLFHHSPEEKIFIGKAGERVYFQPCWEEFKHWWDDEDEDITTTAVIVVESAEKGTVKKNGDGQYTLSHNDTNISLAVSASSTAIRYQIENPDMVDKTDETDETDETEYWLYAYCSGEAYGRSAWATIDDYGRRGSFGGLDIKETYHIEYVLYSPDGVFAWFDGTGEPFDMTTKGADKVGGEITDITADFAVIMVDYEFFGVDATAWIRYKKDGDNEWEYIQKWVGGECIGSEQIGWIDADTRYMVELVSADKETVYDSKKVTTGIYESEDGVTVTVNEQRDYVWIDVTGYDVNVKDKNIRALEVEMQYTDHLGIRQIARKSEDIKSDEFKDDEEICLWVHDLELDTEYKDARIRVGWKIQNPDARGYRYQWIYSERISFSTKKKEEIKAENISAEITAVGLTTADVTVEVVKEIPSYRWFYLKCSYRLKGETYWRYQGKKSFYGSNGIGAVTFRLYDLKEADYEIQFQIDGTTKIQEYHFTPVSEGDAEGDVNTTVKVTKKFVNGLEFEVALTGVDADSKDIYTCRFAVDNMDYYYGEITLDPTKPVKKQIDDSWRIYPGEKQSWRYAVYKNGKEYYIGHLDVSETQTFPLELDILSVKTEPSGTSVAVNVKNGSDIIVEDDEESWEYGEYIGTRVLLREKGSEKWEKFDSSVRFYRNEDIIDAYDYVWLDRKKLTSGQYELRLVSYGDGSVIYAEKSFTVAGGDAWEISEENNFVYNSKNTSRSIALSGNYEKPTVEVENTNIVSVKEIRQSKIYLDIHTIGTTKLSVTADGFTKNITVTVSPSAQELFYLESADECLKDIRLPENCKWVNPSDTPKADDENKVQYFDVVIMESDKTTYGKVPVAVGTLEEDGIAIEGKDTIGVGRENTYSVFYTGKGFDVAYYGEGKAYEISQEWTGDDGLVIKEGGKERNVTVTGAGAGEHELTLTVKVKNLQTGNTLKRKVTQKINVIGEGLVDNLIIKPAKEQPMDVMPYTYMAMATGSVIDGRVVSGQVIEINYDGYDLSKTNHLLLEAKTDKGVKDEETQEPVLENVPVKWSSENEDIFAIDETGLLTIKSRGEGRLTVTAQDDAKYTEQVFVKVYDDAPFFASTEIMVRAGMTEGTKLPYKSRNENSVRGMALIGSDRLELVRHGGWEGGYFLRTKEGYTYTEETTENITLKIATYNWIDDQKKIYDQPLTVTVLPEPKVTLDADMDTGALTFSQTAVPNLFYVNSEAVFEVADSYKDYEIEDIRTIEADKDMQNFHVKRYNATERTITFTAYGLDASSVDAYTVKNSSSAVANVEVKFKGYDGYYPKDGNGIPIKVAVQNKPVSALKAEDAVVTDSLNTARVDALDKKTVFDLSGSRFAIVPAKTKAENITAMVENGSLKLTQTRAGAKGGKYTFTVTNPNWTKALTLTGKISKVDVSKLSLKLSKTKATLNTTYHDKVKINLSIKGNANIPFTIDTDVTPATDALIVKTSEDHRSITLSTAEGRTLAPGKYTIGVTGKIGEEKMKVAKLTLMVTDLNPEVTLSVKGNINILNRDLSYLTCTATMKNTDAKMQSAVITGEGADTFQIVDNDGETFRVKALKNVETIDTKNPYRIKFKLTLSNGAVIENVKGVTIKVKPVDKSPKITVNAPKKPVISKTAGNDIKVSLDMEAGYRIAKIELDGQDKDQFGIKMNGQDAFTICLTENASSVEPKNYSLKYKIYFVGANATTKPVTKNIKITVSD